MNTENLCRHKSAISRTHKCVAQPITQMRGWAPLLACSDDSWLLSLSLVGTLMMMHLPFLPFTTTAAEDGKFYVHYEVIGNNQVAVPTHLFKVILARKPRKELRTLTTGRAKGKTFLAKNNEIGGGREHTTSSPMRNNAGSQSMPPPQQPDLGQISQADRLPQQAVVLSTDVIPECALAAFVVANAPLEVDLPLDTFQVSDQPGWVSQGITPSGV